MDKLNSCTIPPRNLPLRYPCRPAKLRLLQAMRDPSNQQCSDKVSEHVLRGGTTYSNSWSKHLHASTCLPSKTCVTLKIVLPFSALATQCQRERERELERGSRQIIRQNKLYTVQTCKRKMLLFIEASCIEDRLYTGLRHKTNSCR